MTNLIAYIPVLNRRHVEWFKRHPGSNLSLISQKMAEELLPRLVRNVGANSTEDMVAMIDVLNLIGRVDIFDREWEDEESGRSSFGGWSSYILPDEDVSHAVAEKVLVPAGCICQFEPIWARYDMTAVKRQTPVMEGIETSTFHDQRMEVARRIAKKSPDWWRQIGAAVFCGVDCVAITYNGHYPTEYVTDILGDPRMNVDAGQIGKYVSFHAEKTALMQCARKGIPTLGAALYTTVFPCEDCARAIVLSGIDHVFFEEGYSALDAREILEGAGVKIVRVVKDPVSA